MEEQNKEKQTQPKTEQKESKFNIEYDSGKAFSFLVNNMDPLKVLARCIDCVVKIHHALSSIDGQFATEFKNAIQQQEWIWSQQNKEKLAGKAQVPND